MNRKLLHTEVQQYIRSFEGELSQLAFAGSKFEGITVQELIQQVEGYRKTAKKLPKWHDSFGIYYPPKIHIEQTSSEATASYKTTLIDGSSGIDVTGGLGIDTFHFSEVFEKVTHCEINHELSEIAKHNFEILGTTSIEFINADGVETALSSFHDVIYIDPSRRHDTKGKVFYLRDCEPNVPAHLPALMECCHALLVKTSPMLDLSVGMSELQDVAEIHIVAVNNEVKEILWLIKKGAGATKVVTVNLSKNKSQKFEFSYGESERLTYHLPKKYLYEPNAAIMKSGAFTLIPESFNVEKVAQHTHLYTSDSLVEFPGRRFQVEQVIPYTKKEMLTHIKGIKAHVTTRNVPETVAALRKKWNIKDGGDVYLFFITLENNDRMVLQCSKIIG